MTHMKPDQARRVLEDHKTHGTPIRPTDAQQALETIAADQVEYSQQIWHDGEWKLIYEDLWYDSPDDCSDLWTVIEPWKLPLGPIAVRTVARRASAPWVAPDDE